VEFLSFFARYPTERHAVVRKATTRPPNGGVKGTFLTVLGATALAGPSTEAELIGKPSP
jgi:hypothetical protein